MISLSPRLQVVASFVPAGTVVADIGTDHGYLPIYLIQQGICARGVASDIGEGPLLRAKEHIAKVGLEQEIKTHLAPGIDDLVLACCNTFCICGMGGEMIAEILGQSALVKRENTRLILQPMSAMEDLRLFLFLNGFSIIEEKLCLEGKRLYTILVAEPAKSKENFSLLDCYIGPFLVEHKDPLLPLLLEKEKKRTFGALEGLKRGKKEIPQEELQKKEELLAGLEQLEKEWNGE